MTESIKVGTEPNAPPIRSITAPRSRPEKPSRTTAVQPACAFPYASSCARLSGRMEPPLMVF